MAEVIDTGSQVLELTPSAPSPIVHQPASTALAEHSPAGIMLAALSRGVAPADLREMLALQREWQADQARAAFHEALASFKAERIVVAKNKQVGYTAKNGTFVGYKHAELVDVVEAVSPVLARFGLSFRWDVKQAKDWITVTCILSHKLGHSERVEMSGPPDASGNKNALQQIASATSYLQRYTLKAITGVAEGGEDDDAGGADAQRAEEERRQAEGEQRQGQQQPQGRTDPAAYDPEAFERNLPAWRAAIAAGKKTAEQLIDTVQTKGLLTQQQKARITAA